MTSTRFCFCYNVYLNLCVQTDRAAMLDEIVDYVKFLRLQVKVLTFRIYKGIIML